MKALDTYFTGLETAMVGKGQGRCPSTIYRGRTDTRPHGRAVLAKSGKHGMPLQNPGMMQTGV